MSKVRVFVIGCGMTKVSCRREEKIRKLRSEKIIVITPSLTIIVHIHSIRLSNYHSIFRRSIESDVSGPRRALDLGLISEKMLEL
jgi:hypothetical protein